MKKLGIALVLSCLSAISVHAEDRLCNELLVGLSSEVTTSIHDLAKLRYDLDQRSAQGLNDLVTRTLRAEFDKKWLEVLNASQLDQTVLLSAVRTEVQTIQREAESITARQGEVRKEQSQEEIAVKHTVEHLLDLNEPRHRYAQSLLPSGRVLVAGGYGNKYSSQDVLSSIELIDPIAKTATKIIDLREARYDHTQSVLPGGRVLVVGGIGLNSKPLSSIELIDPIAKTVEKIADLNGPRRWYAQSLLPDGRALVTGGNGDQGLLSSIEMIDPIAKMTNGIGELEDPRSEHTQSTLPDGRVLVVGGIGLGSNLLSSIELIDPIGKKVEKIGHLKEARYGHTQSVLPDGRVLVIGGEGSAEDPLASIELIDPIARTVEKVGDLKEARYDHTQSVLPDGRVLIAGGKGSGYSTLSSIELIDPMSKTIEMIDDLKDARNGHIQDVLADGRVLVMGGQGKKGILSSVEIIKVERR